MKRHLLISLFLMIGTCLFAQNPLERIYEYDESGNRTCRHVLEMKGSPKSLTGQNNGDGSQEENAYYVSEIGEITVHVYPNPVRELLFVQITNYKDFQSGELFLYSIDGKFLKRIPVNEDKIEINLSEYPSGVYLLKLKINNFHQEWKIIKNN